MPGRKRKPAALKIMQGNPGGRPIPPEPNFPPGIGRCPGWLDKEARREWRRVTLALAELDLLRATDVGVLSSYCAAYSRWIAAEKLVAEAGPIQQVTTHRGRELLVKHPALAIAEQSQKMMLRAGALLGFNPADRSKVSAPPKQQANPFGDLDEENSSPGFKIEAGK